MALLKIKKSIFYLITFLIFIFVIEFLFRIVLFSITLNANIFKYGFDKRIELKIIDLSKLNFLIVNSDISKSNIFKNKTLNNKISIWTFGGSTTAAYCINSTSWPSELANLNDRFVVTNFAKPGTNSNYALIKLSEELSKQQLKPDIILWANKDNEQFNFEQNLEVKTIVFAKRISKTLKSYFIFALLYDNFIFKFNKHVLKKSIKDFRTKFETNELYNQAILNYNKNTISAIFLSKKYNADFFLVSLFGKFDVETMKFYNNPFWNFFENNSIYLEKEYGIKFINTEAILKNNSFNLDKKTKYFCDNTHQTTEGNKLISKIINDVISEN